MLVFFYISELVTRLRHAESDLRILYKNCDKQMTHFKILVKKKVCTSVFETVQLNTKLFDGRSLGSRPQTFSVSLRSWKIPLIFFPAGV